MNVEIIDGVTTKVIFDRQGGNPLRLEIVQGTGYNPAGDLTDQYLWFYVSADQSDLPIDPAVGDDQSVDLDPDPLDSLNTRVAKSIAATLLPDLTAVRKATRELAETRRQVPVA